MTTLYFLLALDSTLRVRTELADGHKIIGTIEVDDAIAAAIMDKAEGASHRKAMTEAFALAHADGQLPADYDCGSALAQPLLPAIVAQATQRT